MGKILETKDFLDDNIQIRKDVEYSEYIKMMESGPPIMTTYYQISNLSTTDEGLENVEEFIGPNSPLRFNRINNFPLFNIQNVALDINFDDLVQTADFSSDATVLPRTIVPRPNEFFMINYLDKRYLFKVTEVQTDSIKSNNYYKIPFEFNRIDADSLIENQVVEIFDCIYDKVGSEYNAIIKADTAKLLSLLNYVYGITKNSYVDLFFRKKFNSFIFDIVEGVTIYNKYATVFCANNSLFSDDKDYDSLYLRIESFKENNFNSMYNQTIYRALEINDKTLIKDTSKVFVFPIIYMNSVFYRQPDQYWDVKFIPDESVNNELIYTLIDPELISNIESNTLAGSDKLIENIVIKYFNNIEFIVGDFEFLKTYNMEYDTRNNSYVPMVLFIIKRIMDNILLK